MNPRLALSPKVVLLAVVAVAVLFTLLFAQWTATSAFSFPRFLLALPFFIYFPGRFLLDTTRVQLLPLEHLSLALVLGLLASSLVYWIAMFLGVPALFPLWLLMAATVCAYRVRRQWEELVRWRLRLDGSHLLLLGVLAVVVGLLGVVPVYYRNMTLLPNGELEYRNLPDLTLHLAFINELSHSIPPQVPFIAGHPLTYHYASDLPAAFFSTFAGLNPLDLTVRFMPTFFFVMTTLSIYSFSRAWLQSGRAAALATFLVILGEDLAFIPGLWFRSELCWSAQYFGVPSSLSLYFLNPMLSALGVLFAGLFCFLKFFQEGGKGWLLLTALLFATVLEFKVFIAVQVILVLFLAALVYLIVYRDRRLLVLFLLTALFLMVLALPMWQANGSGAHQTIRPHPTQYLPTFARQIGMAETRLGQRVIDLFNGGPLTLKRLAVGFLIVLPTYLVGSFGGRLFGLPRLVKDLFVPTEVPRFFLALFVFVGPLLTLTCVVASGDKPLEMQYNNSSWFFIQSKYLAWIFAVECLCTAAWLRARGLRVAAVVLLLALAIPSTVQFFWFYSNNSRLWYTSEVLSCKDAEVMTFLTSQGSPGQVAMARHEVGLPITALTRCRSPISPLHVFSDQFVSASELHERQEDWNLFWQNWERGSVQTNTLLKYRVDYLIVDKAKGQTEPDFASFEKRQGTGSDELLLRRCFENEGFMIYRVYPLSSALREARAEAASAIP